MAITGYQRSTALAQGDQQELQLLRDKARRNGTKGQQEDVGDLVEYNTNPTFSPCTARGLRAAMTDEQLDAAAWITPTPQARLLIRQVKHRDAGLYPDEELFYRWHSQRNQYWLLDRETLLHNADDVYDIAYESHTPRGLARRAHEHRQGDKQELREALQSRVVGDKDRDSRFHGRKRSRETLNDIINDSQEGVMLDQDEINPVKHGFDRTAGKRRKLSEEEQRWAEMAEESEETMEDDEETGDLDETALLEGESVDPDPIDKLREKYGDLLEIVYYNDATALELQKVLHALHVAIPEPSKKSRRDDFKEALFKAQEEGLIPEHVVMMPTDPARAKKAQDLVPTDALERNYQSGVNYEDGRITRNRRGTAITTTSEVEKLGTTLHVP